MKKAKSRIGISITQDLKEDLENYAKKEDRYPTSITNSIIARHIKIKIKKEKKNGK